MSELNLSEISVNMEVDITDAGAPVCQSFRKDTFYTCGDCGQHFSTLCSLHSHLMTTCHVGSYHFDYATKTAFPLHGSVCSSTQTFGIEHSQDVTSSVANKLTETLKDEREKSPGMGNESDTPNVCDIDMLQSGKSKATEMTNNETNIGISQMTNHNYSKYRLRPCAVYMQRIDGINSVFKRKFNKKSRLHNCHGQMNVTDPETLTAVRKVEAADDDACRVKDETISQVSSHNDIFGIATSVNGDNKGDSGAKYKDIECGNSSYLGLYKNFVSNIDGSENTNPEMTNKTVEIESGSKNDRNLKLNKRKSVRKQRVAETKTLVSPDIFSSESDNDMTLEDITRETEEVKRKLEKVLSHLSSDKEIDKTCTNSVTEEAMANIASVNSCTVSSDRDAHIEISKVKDEPITDDRITVIATWIPDAFRSDIDSDVVKGMSETLTSNNSVKEENTSVGIKKDNRDAVIKSKYSICDTCGKSIRKENIAGHKNRHKGVKPFICEICGKAYPAQKQLLTHQKQAHTDKEQRNKKQCPYCDKTFLQNSNLKTHLLVHTKEKPFQCGVCGKGYGCWKRCKEHETVVHGNAELHQCPKCDKKFKWRNNWQIHVASHSKVHICSVCFKQFSHQTSMKRHMRTHTKEKPHSCHICGHKFVQKTPFWVHMDRHHDLTKADLIRMFPEKHGDESQKVPDVLEQTQ